LRPAAWADEAAAKKWIDSEFQPSTLSKDKQMAEMKWFIDAAAKLKAKGVNEINVVSETITTHEYESKTLAKAFEEITGIKVKHDIIQEGDVVEKLQTSMQSGKSIYDGWISDSDLIGTHYRYGKIMNLTDYMAGVGKEFTNPGIDLKDFIGTSSPPRRTASSTSCPTSSSPTCTGSAPTVRAQGPAGEVQGQVRL
jgi:glycerol transport system substrate-binding protein